MTGLDSTLTIQNSSLTNNTATYVGGGLFVGYAGGPVTISDTVISGNSVDLFGGGIFFLGIYDTAALHHVTNVENAANGGDGIFVYGGTLDVDNCIIANGVGTGDDIGTGVERIGHHAHPDRHADGA